LECWNGGAYVCDRVRYHGAPVRIEHASLAIIGGMVPDRLREALADADDGLVERLIYVWPDPVPMALLMQPNDAPCCIRSRADYVPLKWAPTITASRRRVGRALTPSYPMLRCTRRLPCVVTPCCAATGTPLLRPKQYRQSAGRRLARKAAKSRWKG
jgi:hypothetical protein